MKNKLFCLSFIILFGFATSICTAKYSGGDGSESNPYRIANAYDMNDIGLHDEDWSSHFVLTDDINLAQFTGTKFNIIGVPYTPPFTGVFDGNDYTISNFTYTSPDANFIGLFAFVGKNGKVKQLVMQNVNASGNKYTAGLAGLNLGKIYDCTITSTISGNHSTGGLAGGNYGEISDCSVTAQVQGVDETGGLVGDNSGTIRDCYANSNVDGNSVTGGLVGTNIGLISDGLISLSYATGEVSGYDLVGGLVGWNVYGAVSYCYTTGIVEGNNGAGGLVGWNVYSTISDCYSKASVLGDNHIGGLVGDNGRSTISNCYSAGVVDGNDHMGGLIGDDHDGTITDCFWDIESSGQSSSDGPEVGKSTADMQTESTFTSAGWDFVGETANGTEDIWKMCYDPDYPHLFWEKCPRPSLEMPMHFTPRMLNPKSKGKWVKAHFILPEGFTVEDVNTNSPAKIVEPFMADSNYMDVFINEDGLVKIMAAFDRAVFCSNGSMLEDIVVIARLTTGQYFYGTDTIRIKTNNLEYLAVLTSYWLEAGCGEPDWCEGADLDQSSVVDFIDFAFFDGCCLEFIQN